MTTKLITRSVFLFIIGISLLTVPAEAQTSAFNYQGRLTDGGNPASGSFQMQFKLFNALSGGAQQGSTLNDVPVNVTGGTFSVRLDFGSSVFTGSNRWIEIAVRRNSGESYVTLSPREQVASSPYAVRTLSANSADGLSATCVGCVQDVNISGVAGTKVTGSVASSTNSAQLGGVNANQFVQTNDARLTDARNPLPNSTNYIQNTQTPQASSNFNISGTGTAGAMNINGPMTLAGIAAPAVSPAGQARFFFNTATNKFRISENGGPYVDLVGATGISGSGSVNRIPFWSAGTTLGDSNIFQAGTNIGINMAAPQTRLHVNGTTWFQGDSTPLPPAAGKGIAVGFAGEQGYLFGFDYGTFTAKNLILNGPGGSVGIGTTSPFGKLGVATSGFGISHTDGAVNLSTFINGSGGWLGTVSNHALHFYTNNSQPQMTLTQGGFLGIGNTAPTHALDVNGFFRTRHSAGGNVVSESTGGINSWAKLWVRTPVQSWSIGSSHTFNGNQLYFSNETTGLIQMAIMPNGNVGIGTTNPGTKLDVAGTTKTGILQITGGSDLAENFEVAGPVEPRPGMVVSIDPNRPGKLKVSNREYDKRVAGIISGANGVSAGMLLPDLSASPDTVPVALSGRVWVHADATSAPIRVGELLTTSSTPGHAMSARSPRRSHGAILGKAMTPLASGTGMVLVLVSLK